MSIEIFKYLDGEFNKNTNKFIEKRMAIDKEFKNKVELCQDINKFLEMEGVFEKARKRVKAIHRDWLKNNHGILD